MKENYVIYYHNDLDGRAAAAIIDQMLYCKINKECGAGHYEQKVKKVPVWHSSMPLDFSMCDKNTIAYILDYSPSSGEEIRMLDDYCKDHKVIILDHHESSNILMTYHNIERQITDHGYIRPQNDYSAVRLCYIYSMLLLRKNGECVYLYEYMEHTMKKATPYNTLNWISFISDNDTFKNALDNSKYFALGMMNEEDIDYTLACLAEKAIAIADIKMNTDELSETQNKYITKLVRMIVEETNRVISTGKILSKYQEKLNKNIMHNSFEIQIDIDIPRDYIDPDNTLGLEEEIIRSGKFICVNGYGNSRVFGEAYNEYDGVIIFHFNGEKWEYSCFSKEGNEFQCNLLALYYRKKFGMNGGGHHHAAGWSAPTCLYKASKTYTLMDNV